MLAAGEEGSGIPTHMGLEDLQSVHLGVVDGAAGVGQVLPGVHDLRQEAHGLGLDLTQEARAQGQGLVAARLAGPELVAQGLVANAVFQAQFGPLGKIEGRTQTPGTLGLGGPEKTRDQEEAGGSEETKRRDDHAAA